MMRRTASLLTLAVLALAACSPKAAAPTTTGESTTTSRASAEPARFPLTGLPAKPGEDVNRPVLAVKVENDPLARPQAGLDAADVVYEEVVEGGFTRFIAFFQSHDPELAGPIRSVRPVDPDILVAYGKPILAFSGGISTFKRALADIGVVLVNEDDDGTQAGLDRRPGYRAPHDLFANAKAVREFVAKSGKGQPAPAPSGIFSFVGVPSPSTTPTAPASLTATTTSAAPVSPTLASAAVVEFSRDQPMEWRFDKAKDAWLRFSNDGTEHKAEGGGQVATTNVVILSVNPLPTDNVDASGAPVPSWELVGSGGLTVLSSGGRVITGTWTREALDKPTRYVDRSGTPIQLVPGVTWVQLLPSDRSVRLS